MGHKNNKKEDNMDKVEEAVYNSLVFTSLTNIGDLDNTSQNLFLYLNSDKIQEEIKNEKK
ncbi:MAG: hypothetical protein ACRCXT_13915 [Paraclostridium sp.]